MKKYFAWLICLCVLVACAAPISQPTETPFPTITAETSTPATLTKTPVPSPSSTPTLNCAEPFQIPESTDATLLNASAQQAQMFSQQIFNQIRSACPDFSDDFDDLVLSKTEMGWDWNSYVKEVTLEPGAVYLRPTSNMSWVALRNPDLMQAPNFVLEFTIAPKVDNNISARFTVHWRGDSYCSPVLVFWPNRQYWDISDCINTDGFISGSGLTRELQGDQPIKVLLIQVGKYVAFYINGKPFGFFHAYGVRPYIDFSAATDQQKTEFAIDYVKLWKLPRNSQISLPEEISFPEVSSRPDLSKVPPIPGSFGLIPDTGLLDVGEMQIIRSAGFTHLRGGLGWQDTEIEKGVYNHTLPDIYVEHVLREGLPLHMIIQLYPHWMPENFPYPENYRDWLPPLSAEAQVHYMPFFEETVRHYQNKGIVWELDGEPNRTYSSGKEYAELMKVLIPAIRRNDPSGLIVGPNIDQIDRSFPLSFIKALGDAGLLTELDAIGLSAYKTDGVFPNNTGKPEDILDPVLNIRKITDSYSPDRQIPIVVNEWGYEINTVGYEKQAKFITRMQLFDLAIDMPYTMLYLWRDWFVGGVQQSELWGLVDGDLKPYPSYQAMQTLTTTLNGYEFVRRMPVRATSDYILFFRKEKKAALAVWTAYSSRAINIPVACPNPKAVDMMGNAYKVEETDTELTVTISDAPTYILCQDNAPAELIFWKPARTIQSISQAKPNVLVEISNSSDATIAGKFVLKSASFTDSEVPVSLASGQSMTIEIPVPIKEWRINILPVQMDFVSEDGSVQSAMLWLSIIQSK